MRWWDFPHYYVLSSFFPTHDRLDLPNFFLFLFPFFCSFNFSIVCSCKVRLSIMNLPFIYIYIYWLCFYTFMRHLMPTDHGVHYWYSSNIDIFPNLYTNSTHAWLNIVITFSVHACTLIIYIESHNFNTTQKSPCYQNIERKPLDVVDYREV